MTRKITFYLILFANLVFSLCMAEENKTHKPGEVSTSLHVNLDASVTSTNGFTFYCSGYQQPGKIRVDIVEGDKADLDVYIIESATIDAEHVEVSHVYKEDKKYIYVVHNGLSEGWHELKYILVEKYKVDFGKIFDSIKFGMYDLNEYGTKLYNVLPTYTKISYSVSLPYGEKILEHIVVYRNKNGDLEEMERGSYISEYRENGEFYFETKPGFNSTYLGFEIRWRKGLIKAVKTPEPDKVFKEHSDVVTAWFIFFITLVYHAYIWNKVDGAVINDVQASRYAPSGFSPSSLRYLIKEKYEDILFAIALISIAYKNYIKIKISSYLSIEKFSYDEYKLSIAEVALCRELFKDKDVITYTAKDKVYLYKAALAFKDALNKEVNRAYITFSGSYFIIGFIMSLLGIISVYLIPFQKATVSIFFPISVISTNLVAFIYLKTPMLRGDKFNAEVTSFKLYLRGASSSKTDAQGSKELLEMHTVATKTFEDNVAYALALDVPDSWGKVFSNNPECKDYKPFWYDGTDFDINRAGESYKKILSTLSSFKNITD